MTLDMLDLQHSAETKFYDAPLHLKALNGMLLIDDFGRQKFKPDELLNRMDGPTVYRHAVRLMSDVTEQAVQRAGLTVADIDLFVYHQANSRIIDAVGQKLRLDPARVIDVVGSFANTSAASLPIALAAAGRDGRLHDGDRVLMAAFGAGLVWGGVVVTWGRTVR